MTVEFIGNVYVIKELLNNRNILNMRTNRKYLGIIIGVIFSLSLQAQESVQPNSEHFYYYEGGKMFLQQNTKKLLIRFAANMNCLNHDFNKMPKIIKNPTNLENLIEITVQTNTDKILIH